MGIFMCLLARKSCCLARCYHCNGDSGTCGFLSPPSLTGPFFPSLLFGELWSYSTVPAWKTCWFSVWTFTSVCRMGSASFSSSAFYTREAVCGSIWIFRECMHFQKWPITSSDHRLSKLENSCWVSSEFRLISFVIKDILISTFPLYLKQINS